MPFIGVTLASTIAYHSLGSNLTCADPKARGCKRRPDIEGIRGQVLDVQVQDEEKVGVLGILTYRLGFRVWDLGGRFFSIWMLFLAREP